MKVEEREQLHLALVFLFSSSSASLLVSEHVCAASDIQEVSVCFTGDLKRQSALSFLSFLLFTVDSR